MKKEKKNHETKPSRTKETTPTKTKEAKVEGKRIQSTSDYEEELLRLQMELVKLQEWVKKEKAKIVVIFEGRDAAGKGGVVKRITERLNPRVCKVVALGIPRGRKPNGIFNDMYRTCLLVERSS